MIAYRERDRSMTVICLNFLDERIELIDGLLLFPLLDEHADLVEVG